MVAQKALMDLGVAVETAFESSGECVVIDERIVLFGGAPVLGFARKEDCSIRICSIEVAKELASRLNAHLLPK